MYKGEYAGSTWTFIWESDRWVARKDGIIVDMPLLVELLTILGVPRA